MIVYEFRKEKVGRGPTAAVTPTEEKEKWEVGPGELTPGVTSGVSRRGIVRGRRGSTESFKEFTRNLPPLRGGKNWAQKPATHGATSRTDWAVDHGVNVACGGWKKPVWDDGRDWKVPVKARKMKTPASASEKCTGNGAVCLGGGPR